MKRDRSSSASPNRRCRLKRMDEEFGQVVWHSTTFQNSAMAFRPPPPKRLRECETELGIFPDIPDARLKKEFDEGTIFDLSEEGLNENSSMYITAEADESVLETTRPEMIERESQGLLGIKIEMDVFPASNYVQAKVEGYDEGSKMDGVILLQQHETEVETRNETRSGPSIIPMKESDNSFSCSCIYCRHSICWKSRRHIKRNMQLHYVRYHPEHFFREEEKEQVSGVKRKQFQRILVDFLFPEFIRRVEATRSCVLCGQKYQNYRYWSLNEIGVRKHLVTKHGNEMKTRLAGILEDEGLEAKLTTCKADGVWCRCGVYLPRWEGMQAKHKQFYCKLVEPENNEEGRGSKEMCEKLSELHKDDRVKVTDNSKVVHSNVQAKAASLNPPSSSSKIEVQGHEESGREAPVILVKTEVLSECTDNQTSFELGDPLGCDSPFECDDLFDCDDEDISVLCQEDVEGEVVIEVPIQNEQSSTNSESSNEVQKTVNQSSSKSPTLKCTYCRFVCRAGTSDNKKLELQLHIFRHHPEHFFREEKEQLSGVKHKQFQRILLGFLFPRFIQNIGDYRSCTLCGEAKKYLNSSRHINYVYLRRHLIVDHKNELKEDLQVILGNPRLEEKLIGSGKTEAYCECGMYVPRTMDKHKKLYCNLTLPNKSLEIDPVLPQHQRDFSSKCTYCDFYPHAKRGNSMELHLVQFHPEHYFSEERDKALGLGLKHEVFQKLVGYMWQQFIRKAGNRGAIRSRCCALCSRKYSNLDVNIIDVKVKRHLIFEHKDKLKERFQVVFEDIARGASLRHYL